jgi:hypothetical protein
MGKNAIAKGCKDSKDCKDDFSLTQENVITEIICETTYLRVRSQTTLPILASLQDAVPNRVGDGGEEVSTNRLHSLPVGLLWFSS